MIGTHKLDISGYPQQMEFIQNKDFESAFVAGLGSGKTHGGATKSLIFALANPGAWGIVTAPQHRILEIATIPTYERVFPKELVVHTKSRPHPEWRLANGCRIFFWSTDKPETISGAELAWAHMDEGSLSPYMAYMNIKKRLRQRDKESQPYPFQLWITTTPRQLNWLYHACTKGDVPITMFNASTRDNIYLDDVEGYIERIGLTGKEYEQEIEGKFLMLMGDCLFRQESLDIQLSNCLEPISIEDDGHTSIWQEYVVGNKYIAAADCADEGGGGVNDMVIVDAQTGAVVLEINADIRADKFAHLCFNRLSDYNAPLFAPERNHTVGGIVVTKMIDLGYPNIYIDDKGKEGWYTHASADLPKIDRFRMLTEFEEAIRMRQWIERSSDAVGEMSTFVRNEKNKFEPRPGYKGDRVMSRAICWQLRSKALTNQASFLSVTREASTYGKVRGR